MASEYYTHGTYPIAGSTGSSALLRSELDAIDAGFQKLPVMAGNGGKFALVNAAGNALTVSAGITEGTGGNLTFSGSAMTWSGNPTHSGNHTFSGNVTVNGTFSWPGLATTLASPPAIGNTTPNSGRFTAVASTVGGYTFPDATVQTTAAGSGAFTSYQALCVLTYLDY